MPKKVGPEHSVLSGKNHELRATKIDSPFFNCSLRSLGVLSHCFFKKGGQVTSIMGQGLCPINYLFVFSVFIVRGSCWPHMARSFRIYSPIKCINDCYGSLQSMAIKTRPANLTQTIDAISLLDRASHCRRVYALPGQIPSRSGLWVAVFNSVVF